jgi:hypothetical protein
MLGLAISNKKIIPRKTEQIVHSDGIPAVPRKRKLPEFHSEDKNARNSSPLNRNKSKLLKLCSEAFAEEKTD